MADSSRVSGIIRAIGLKMEEEKEHLIELNQLADDSDHGTDLTRGFGTVEGKLDSPEGKDVGTILKMVGMTFVSTVGGASGPSYGTTYMKAGTVPAGKNKMNIADLLAVMRAAVEGAMQRGHATMEEATMLDAMVPSLTTMETVAGEGKSTAGVLGEGMRAARTGTKHTKDLVVTGGQISYVDEHGLGHQDPGVASYSYMPEAIARLVGR